MPSKYKPPTQKKTVLTNGYNPGAYIWDFTVYKFLKEHYIFAATRENEKSKHSCASSTCNNNLTHRLNRF